MIDHRFETAVHALVVLGGWGEPTSSETVAYSLDTNPVVVRRLLGELREAGLVRSRRGPNGGFELVQPAEETTLGDVYRALDGDPFESYEGYPADWCPVGSRMPAALEEAVEPARSALERELDTVTVADLFEAIRSDAEAEHGRPLVEVSTELREQRRRMESSE